MDVWKQPSDGPGMNGNWRGWRCLLAFVVALACSACAVQGQSPTEMKRDLQRTFLYQSATAFADGSNGPFDAQGRLTEPQKKYIVGEYQKMVKNLLDTHTKYQVPLQEAFPSMKQARMKPRVLMSDSDLAAPKVNADGEIFIDIRVARLMFRDAVLTSMKSDELGAPGFMDGWKKYCGTRPVSDADHLNCFLHLKTRIDNIRDQSMLGMVFDQSTWDLDDDAPWFLAADLAIQSVDLQSRYAGVLLFVTAHELGHVLLGHLEAEKAGKFITTSQRMNAERQADDFAVTLMALATAESALLPGVDTIATGYDDFFTHTYANARWNDAGDSHPTSAERLRRARALHETIRDKQVNDLWSALARQIVADPQIPATSQP